MSAGVASASMSTTWNGTRAWRSSTSEPPCGSEAYSMLYGLTGLEPIRSETVSMFKALYEVRAGVAKTRRAWKSKGISISTATKA